MTTVTQSIRIPRLSVLRTALVGAAVLGVLYVVCWIGTAFAVPPVSHMFISIFTPQPVGSQAALLEGTVWAIGFGAASGALVAIFFNLFKAGR